MNKVILTGNLCRDIELRTTASGTYVISNCIAVARDFKEPDGTYKSDFINIVAWSNQAEYLAKYAKKGDRLELSGRWQVRTYTNKDGSTATANECVIENVRAFAKKDEPEQEAKTSAPAAVDVEDEEYDDLPF